jgi:hypothetical protein
MNEIAIFALGFFAAIGCVVVLASLMEHTKAFQTKAAIPSEMS